VKWLISSTCSNINPATIRYVNYSHPLVHSSKPDLFGVDLTCSGYGESLEGALSKKGDRDVVWPLDLFHGLRPHSSRLSAARLVTNDSSCMERRSRHDCHCHWSKNAKMFTKYKSKHCADETTGSLPLRMSPLVYRHNGSLEIRVGVTVSMKSVDPGTFLCKDQLTTGNRLQHRQLIRPSISCLCKFRFVGVPPIQWQRGWLIQRQQRRW